MGGKNPQSRQQQIKIKRPSNPLSQRNHRNTTKIYDSPEKGRMQQHILHQKPYDKNQNKLYPITHKQYMPMV